MFSFNGMIQEFLADWDNTTTVQGTISRHASVGLTEAQLEEFLHSGTWPENTLPARLGVPVLVQPSLVRGEVDIWFDKHYTSIDGAMTVMIRGSKAFIDMTVSELLFQQFAHEVAEKNKETQEKWQSKYGIS